MFAVRNHLLVINFVIFVRFFEHKTNVIVFVFNIAVLLSPQIPGLICGDVWNEG